LTWIVTCTTGEEGEVRLEVPVDVSGEMLVYAGGHGRREIEIEPARSVYRIVVEKHHRGWESSQNARSRQKFWKPYVIC